MVSKPDRAAMRGASTAIAPADRGQRVAPDEHMNPPERTRFLWTSVWSNEAGRSDGIGDESAEERAGRGGGDGGGGEDGRGPTRAVECAREDRDRVAAAQGRGAGDDLARDPGAGARARAVAADLPRGRDERVQAARQSGGGARTEAGAGKVGELTMKLEIVEWVLEKKATGRR